MAGALLHPMLTNNLFKLTIEKNTGGFSPPRKEQTFMLKLRDGRSVYRALFTLAIPISLQNLITFAVGFADNLMVGTLRNTAISAVYMGTQVQTFLTMMINGLSGAMLILIAQYWGKRDLTSIRRIAAIALRAGLFIGLLLTIASLFFTRPILYLLTPDQAVVEAAVPYLQITGCSCLFFSLSQILIAMLRGVENARVGMCISALALMINITLNYVFIFGLDGVVPAMGITGAAIATLISRIFEAVAAVWYVLRREEVLRWRFSHLFVPCGVLVRDFVRYGGPVMAGDLVWSINTFCQSMVVGRLMDEAIAAASIMNQMNNLIVCVDQRPERVGGHHHRHAGRRRRDGENPPVCKTGAAHVFTGGAFQLRGYFAAARTVYFALQHHPRGPNHRLPAHGAFVRHHYWHLLPGGVPGRAGESRGRHLVCV